VTLLESDQEVVISVGALSSGNGIVILSMLHVEARNVPLVVNAKVAF